MTTKLVNGAVSVGARVYLANKAGRRGREITEYVTGGTVRYDQAADVAMTASFSLKQDIGLREWVDYISPEMVVVHEDGTTYEEPMGLFTPPPPSLTHDPYRTYGTLECFDQTFMLAKTVFRKGLNIPTGTNIINKVKEILTGAGFTNFDIPSSSVVTGKNRTIDPGTKKLAVVNELLLAALYYKLTTDRKGRMVTRKRSRISQREAVTTYFAGEDYPHSMISGTIEEQPDLTGFCNLVVVTRKATDQAAGIIAVAENKDPSDPASTVNIGEYPIEIEDADIESQADAQEIADDTLEMGRTFTRRLTLKTLPDPFLGPYDVINLDIHNRQGRIATGKWWRPAWEVGFTPSSALMTHQVNRTERWTQEDGL